MDRWFETNGLGANLGENHIKKFGCNFSKDYFAFGTSVQINNECKNLRFLLDNKLTFKFQNEHICKQLTKFCGIVWKFRYIFSKQQMPSFYNAYVIPTIT